MTINPSGSRAQEIDIIASPYICEVRPPNKAWFYLENGRGLIPRLPNNRRQYSSVLRLTVPELGIRACHCGEVNYF